MANELDYTKFDFDEIVQQLQDRLRANSEAWKDTVTSGTGEALIELFAYVGNLALYYIERRAEESFIQTARNKSSVINLVELINYKPKRVTSSRGILTFTLDAAHATNITLPKWTECQTAGAIKFVTLEPVTIIAGGTKVEANAVQGEVAVLVATSDGSLGQEYDINETTVEDSADEDNPTLIVSVAGIQWSEVSSFINSTNTSQHYRVLTNLDETVTILFGDNIKGQAPNNGDSINIQYVKSDGINGNVYQNDTITTINDTILENGTSTVVTDINVTNGDPDNPSTSRQFLGGDDAEDIEEIRYEAPRVFSTGDRAVTKEDFIALIENISGVANTNVWGELEEAEAAGVEADVTMLNKVKIAILLQDWNLPDDTQKDLISDTIRSVSMIPVKYEFIDPDMIDIIIEIAVVAAKGSSLTNVQDTIETTLEGHFELGTTTKIGTDIYYSNLVRSVDNLADVVYHDMDVKVRKTLVAGFTSLADYGEILDADPIKPDSVEVYVGEELVAIDDGAGVLVDQSSNYTVTGAINYTTGSIAVDIVESVGMDEVYCIYKQNENGNIITDFTEIAKLYEVTFTSVTIED